MGKHPVAAVEYMVKIAQEVERGLRRRGFAEPMAIGADDSEIVADAAFHAAKSAGVEAIVVLHRKRLQRAADFAVSAVVPGDRDDEPDRRGATAYRKLRRHPVLAPNVTTTDEMIGQMDTLLVSREFLYPGNRVVFVAGTPVGRAGSTNLMKLHTVEGDDEVSATRSNGGYWRPTAPRADFGKPCQPLAPTIILEAGLAATSLSWALRPASHRRVSPRRQFRSRRPGLERRCGIALQPLAMPCRDLHLLARIKPNCAPPTSWSAIRSAD